MNRDRMRLLLTPLRNDRSMPLNHVKLTKSDIKNKAHPLRYCNSTSTKLVCYERSRYKKTINVPRLLKICKFSIGRNFLAKTAEKTLK